MKIKNLLLAITACTAAAAWAQAPASIGSVTSVNGVATVTTGTSGAPVAVGAPIVNGSRVITTSTGTVTVRLNNGCVLTVPPGNAVTIQTDLSCQQLTANIRPVTTAVETSTVTTTSTIPVGMVFGSNTGLIAGAAGLLLIGAVVAADDDDDEPLSAR
jgi:hypothetical protein